MFAKYIFLFFIKNGRFVKTTLGMTTQTEKARLIFGLKIKQLRIEKGMSTYFLAEKTGLSPSYINEIEKGKKYPKTERIFTIAEALNTDYDTLVSLKLNKKLEPIANLLNSNILSDLPLDVFGISAMSLLELMASAPAKLSAFINTIIQIGRNYDMTVSEFYFSVIRTYQEMHDNYFVDLEFEATKFICSHQLPKSPDACLKWCISHVTENYGYNVQYYDGVSKPAIGNLRSVFVKESKIIWLNKTLSVVQQVFTLAREIGYQELKITNRPFESSVIEPKSFEEVLNNFKASYFAGAILIPEKQIITELSVIFEANSWNDRDFLKILSRFPVTSEVFFQRITNVLTSHFELNQLFFIRFNHHTKTDRFLITKEMHLNKLHNPHATALDEHYCRRWVSVKILKELEEKQNKNIANNETICNTQISEYVGSKNQYFVISLAKSSPSHFQNSSINLGFRINTKLKNTFKFLSDPNLSQKVVSETCQRCSLPDCAERAAPPIILDKQIEKQNLKDAVKAMMK